MTTDHAAHVAALTNHELLALHIAVQAELKRRNITTGVFGEHLALQMYGGVLASANTEGYDLTDLDGRRVQVKTRLANRSAGRLRVDLESAEGFDACLVLLLAPVNLEPLMAREVSQDEMVGLKETTQHLHVSHFRAAGIDVLGRASEAWAALGRGG